MKMHLRNLFMVLLVLTPGLAAPAAAQDYVRDVHKATFQAVDDGSEIGWGLVEDGEKLAWGAEDRLSAAAWEAADAIHGNAFNAADIMHEAGFDVLGMGHAYGFDYADRAGDAGFDFANVAHSSTFGLTGAAQAVGFGAAGLAHQETFGTTGYGSTRTFGLLQYGATAGTADFLADTGDADWDGIVDGFDPHPQSRDGDGDGLSDTEELVIGTDPFDVDTDRDGLLDGEEAGLNANPLLADTDGDGIMDGVDPQPSRPTDYVAELETVTRPATEATTSGYSLCYSDQGPTWNRNPLERNYDWDCDGLSDHEEYKIGTKPRNWDTDGDFLPDDVEVRVTRSDPLAVDTDRDGLPDAADPQPLKDSLPPAVEGIESPDGFTRSATFILREVSGVRVTYDSVDPATGESTSACANGGAQETPLYMRHRKDYEVSNRGQYLHVIKIEWGPAHENCQINVRFQDGHDHITDISFEKEKVLGHQNKYEPSAVGLLFAIADPVVRSGSAVHEVYQMSKQTIKHASYANPSACPPGTAAKFAWGVATAGMVARAVAYGSMAGPWGIVAAIGISLGVHVAGEVIANSSCQEFTEAVEITYDVPSQLGTTETVQRSGIHPIYIPLEGAYRVFEDGDGTVEVGYGMARASKQAPGLTLEQVKQVIQGGRAWVPAAQPEMHGFTAGRSGDCTTVYVWMDIVMSARHHPC